ncbi:hypothetical protein Tco_0905417 [Tanacetum coccineum]
MYKVNAINKQETKSVLTSTGLKNDTGVIRPSSRGSSSKNSVLLNTKNHSKDVEVHVRTNKKTNVASKKNVVQNKKIVTNVDVKMLLKQRIRALFTTPTTMTPKSFDTTPVVAKTRFAVVTPLSEKNKDSTAFRLTSLFAKEISLSKYMRTKIKTSRKWQIWYETQPNVGWFPKSFTANAKPSAVKSRNHEVIQIVLWIVDSGCSKHMTGDLKLLKNFVEKFMGTVRFRNDHFAEITSYGDYVHGNMTISHVYYVKGLGHNLFSIRQFLDGDLEVAFRSKTCYV